MGIITVDHLRLIDRPVILHVRAPGQTKFRHWCLFLGWESDGRARLYDPPREAGSVNVAELLSIWDGVAIVVSRDKSDAPAWTFSVPCSVTSLVFVLGAMIGLQLLPKVARGARLVLGLAAVLSFAAQLAEPSAFSRSPMAVANVKQAYFANSSPRIDLETLKPLIGSSGCYLVDARLPSAYHSYRLPRAVNIPVNSGYLRLRREIGAIGPGKTVVVYCQSESCGWADAVAGQLAARGVGNVVVYGGGVNEWRKEIGDD